MNTPPRQSIRYLAISVAVHVVAVATVVVLIQVGWNAYQGREQPEPAETAQAKPAEPEQADAEPGDDAASADADQPDAVTEEAEEMLAREMQRVARMDDQTKMRQLGLKAADLSEVSEQSVGEIATLVEGLYGVSEDERAYAPREGVTGRFKAQTAVLYDIVKTSGADGSVVYEYTMVDEDGRTLKTEIKESAMTPQDEMAYKVMQMGRDNPKMRQLIDAVLKIGHAQLEQQEQAKRAQETETTDEHR